MMPEQIQNTEMRNHADSMLVMITKLYMRIQTGSDAWYRIITYNLRRIVARLCERRNNIVDTYYIFLRFIVLQFLGTLSRFLSFYFYKHTRQQLRQNTSFETTIATSDYRH